MAESSGKQIHRDDLDYKDAEHIVSKLQELYPGSKVVFAGDTGSPEAEKMAEKLQGYLSHLCFNGLCQDCHKQMPNWPEGEMPEDWEPPKGWKCFTDVATDEIMGWQCPECDASEEEGVPSPLVPQEPTEGG